jgi:hypothetical protein
MFLLLKRQGLILLLIAFFLKSAIFFKAEKILKLLLEFSFEALNNTIFAE